MIMQPILPLNSIQPRFFASNGSRELWFRPDSAFWNYSSQDRHESPFYSEVMEAKADALNQLWYGSSTKRKWKWIDERLDVIESWGTSITRTDSPTSARTRISFKWNQAAFATYDKCSQERDGSMSDNVQAAFLSEGFFRRPGHLPNIPEG